MLLSAGQLDPSFGTGGVLALPSAGFQKAAVQSDGKIILIGSDPSSNFIERLNTDGSLDASFGAAGRVATNFPLQEVALQSDGKIIGGGSTKPNSSSADLLLARYNTNGALDTTFGSHGESSAAIPVSTSMTSLVIGSDGKIVISGSGTYQDPAHASDSKYAAPVVLAGRFTSTGALDTSFNGVGYTYQQVTASAFNYAVDPAPALAVQPDGKVLIGSTINDDPALWRFNVDGSLDASFGNGGRAWIPLTYQDLDNDYVSGSFSAIDVLPSGKIVCAGGIDNGGADHNWLLARFNANGTPDTTFASNTTYAPGGGLQFVPVNPLNGSPGSNTGTFPDMAIEADGKIVLGGDNAPRQYLNAFRYSADGVIDPTFSNPQYITGAYGVDVLSMALTPSEQPLFLVQPSSGGYPPTRSTSLVRLQGGSSASPAAPTPLTPATGPGTLNYAFGASGRAFINDPTSVWLPNSVERTVNATAVQADGKIVLAGSVGTTATGGIGQIFVERLNANGSADATFGSNGIVTTSFGPVSFATTIQIQPDGKILVGGATEDSAAAPADQNFALVRYNDNGSLDASFGVGGKLTTSFAGNAQINALSVYANGDIVAVGSYFLYPNAGFHIARYNSSGALESAFGTGGVVTVNLGVAPDHGEATSLALQSDGKLLIGTHQNTSPLQTPVVMRYNQDGTLDATFGTSGIVAVPYAPAGGSINSGTAGAMAVLSTGQIMVAVDDAQPSPNTSQYIVRLTASGQEDATFQQTLLQNNGNAEPIPGPNVPAVSRVLGIYPLQDGSVLIASQQVDVENHTTVLGLTPLVTKLLATGAVDPSFAGSVDPHLVSQPYFQGEVPRASAIKADGSLFIAFDVYTNKVQSTPHWIAVADYIGGAPAVISPAPAGTPGSGPVTPPPVTPPPVTPPPSVLPPAAPLPAGQLTCTVVSATPAKAIAGAKGMMGVKIKNTGKGAWSGPVTINVYASTDSTLSAGDTLLGTLKVQNLSLRAGKTKNVRVPLAIATGLSTGKYLLLASVTETSAGTAPYTTAAPRAVALTAATVDLSVSFNTKKLVKLRSGKPNKLTLLIKNLGNVKATGTINLALTGSSASVFGESLATLTTQHINLDPNHAQHVVLTFTPSADLGSTFNLKAAIASSMSASDANASNDIATVLTQVS